MADIEIVHRKSYIVHRKSYIVHRKSYIVHRTSYIVHRTSYILLVLFFSLNAATAQSWSPINRYEKMNFSQVPLNYISNTIWVDSARVSGSDSVFYFNRIVTNCDTCLATYRLCNQPGFLKKNMYKRSGGTYEFRYPGSVVIKTLASTGQSWLYDTANSINATIYSNSLMSVFGTNDSVKEIHLSDGGILKLSKNHGILQFTGLPVGNVYTLLGIEGRNLGDKVPKFAEIYNFRVGDVFQYSFKQMNYGVGYGNAGLSKVTILSRDSLPGYYNCNIRRISCQWATTIIGHNGDTSHAYELTNISFTDSILNQANYYPAQIIESAIPEAWLGPNCSYQSVTTDTMGIYSKFCGSYNFGDDPPLYQHGNLLNPPQSYELLYPLNSLFLYYNSFKTGLGNTCYKFFFFESEDENQLIGYVKNGDTVGTVYPDDFILAGVKEFSQGNNLQVYPNPCTDQLHVSGFPEGKGTKALIRDISGRELLSTTACSTIDVSSLRPGIYFLFLTDPSGHNLQATRFVKR